MIKKPMSVRLAGAIGLVVFAFDLWGRILHLGERLPADVAAGSALGFVFSGVLLLWWVVGTVRHRLRLNRMRYK